MLPPTARRFICRVISTVENHIPPTGAAVFLFGSLSHARDSADCTNGTSDVDLLVIYKDEFAAQAGKMWPKLNALQQLLPNNTSKRRGAVASILRVIERQTGMHESIFLASERDFSSARFSRIFKTNEVLSRLLAPASIVFGSALCHMIRVHGDVSIEGTVRSMQKTIGYDEHVLVDLVKSLLMNVVLSIGAVVLLPLSKRATKYAVEATKWSMYAATFLIVGKRPPKAGQKRFFTKLGVSTAYLQRWAMLSIHYKVDIKFTLAALWNVVKIHALGFKIKKVR